MPLNQCRVIVKEFGLETARIILGHRSAAITEVYAELDQQKAMEAIVRVGRNFIGTRLLGINKNRAAISCCTFTIR